jgi:CTP synthase (UTP-ammonia lyase)
VPVTSSDLRARALSVFVHVRLSLHSELVAQIGIVGDYDATKPTHRATVAAIAHACEQRGLSCDMTWVATDEISRYGVEVLERFDGLIIAPGSPYRSCDGALAAIEYARIHDLPLLGTCGGFQHVVLEFARNVLGFEDAEHAEYDPYASRLFITPLVCSVGGQAMTVHIEEGSRAARAYGQSTAVEQYYCNFGLNLEYLDDLVNAGLQVTGTDQDGEPRIVELADRRFFVATLFVPQTSSTPRSPHPLIIDFVADASA